MPVRVRVELEARAEWHERGGPIVRIGSAPHVELRIPHASVRPEHLRLVERRGRAIAIDPGGGRRRATVGGRPLEAPVVLGPGDTVEVGDLRLRIEVVPPEALGPVGAILGPVRVGVEADEAIPAARRFRADPVGATLGFGRFGGEADEALPAVRQFRADPLGSEADEPGPAASRANPSRFETSAGAERLELVWATGAGDEARWRARVRTPPTSAHASRILAWTAYGGRPALVERMPAGVRLGRLIAAEAAGRAAAPVGARALVVAHLARALAERHRVGARHGALAPDRVQLGRDGRAVLLAPGPEDPPVDADGGRAARRYGGAPELADDLWALTRLAAGPLRLGGVPGVVELLHRWAGRGEGLDPVEVLEAVRGEGLDPSPTHLARLVRVLEALDEGPLVMVETDAGIG